MIKLFNTKVKTISGYTALNTFQGVQLKVGKTLKYKGQTRTEKKGFSFCHKNPIHALIYYNLSYGEGLPTEFAEVSTEIEDAFIDSNERVCLAPKIKVNKLVTLDELIEAQIKASYQSRNANFIATRNAEKLSSNDDFAIIASDKKWTSAFVSGSNSTIVSCGCLSSLTSSGFGNALLALGSDVRLSSTGSGSYLYANGDCAKVSSVGFKNKIAVIGNRIYVTSSGYCEGICTEGDDAKIFSGGCDAAITVIGDRARITATGDECDVTYNGADGVLFIAGNYGKFSCSEGTLVHAVVYDDSETPIGKLTGCIGQDGLKPNTKYTIQDGKLVEVEVENE